MGKISIRNRELNNKIIDKIIRQALQEDRVEQDLTSQLLFLKDSLAKAEIVAKSEGIIAGLEVALRVFYCLDRGMRLKKFTCDGRKIRRGEKVAFIEGSLKKILAGERTALNFLMRLSGIATMTKRFIEKVRPYRVKILDTRKTTPGLRILEKYAVRVGGGINHRMDLCSGILIKDNHLKEIRHRKLSVKDLVVAVRKKVPRNMEIEIEVKNISEFKEILQAEPDVIMLDNMGLKDIKEAVKIRNKFSDPKKTQLEISGGINLNNVRDFASTGVERISVGALTHSYPSLDFSLNIL